MSFVRFAATLLLLPAFGLSPARAQDASADGGRLFQSRCASCHSVQPGPARIGPNLAGVFGRKAGTAEGARYSEALRNSNVVWTDETLNAYLDNPRQLVSGTTMTVSLRDPAQRSAIVAYLRGLSPANPPQ